MLGKRLGAGAALVGATSGSAQPLVTRSEDLFLWGVPDAASYLQAARPHEGFPEEKEVPLTGGELTALTRT
jgi:hypothetical protein